MEVDYFRRRWLYGYGRVKSLDKNGNIVSSAGTSFANAKVQVLATKLFIKNICKRF